METIIWQFLPMALLKNLQNRYASESKEERTEDLLSEPAGRAELESGQQTAKSAGVENSFHAEVAMRKKKRTPSCSNDASHRKISSPGRLMRRLLGREDVTSPDQMADANEATELGELKKRNRFLAERLENLEDRSWEIRESEEIYRSLSEAFGDLVIHHNANGQRVFQNSVFETYFDDRFAQQFPGLTEFAAQTDNFQPATREIELDTLQGRRWFSWTDLPVRDAQTGEVGVRSVARDITQQKTSQQEILAALTKAENANAAKSRFLAMVSHEIRTPLNGVIGMAGLLSDSKLAPDQRNYVEAISTSGNTLLNLIEDLLDTARIESGHIELTPRPTSITQLVEDVVELVAPAAREKGLELATCIFPDLPPMVMIDSGRLRQILLNLMGNAVKFTVKGGIGLNVGRQNDTETADVLKFTISDSGPGLAEEDQQRIFEEFVQTDDSVTREHGGAGLGLAISQNLAQLMGGMISVSSRIGRGTSFELTVPLEPAESASVSSQGLEPIDQRVALILNRTPARQSLVQTLKQLGANVSSFDSSEAFHVHAVEHDDIDVVIAPFTEWRRDNFKRLQQVLAPTTRLVNISDHTVTDAKNTLDQTGIDAWLTRPVRKQSLYQVLSNRMIESNIQTGSASAWKSSETPLNILLAEDNPINALMAKALLNKIGHRVIHVVDGSQAVEAVEGHSFDLILMDLHMPVMDGLKALETIQQMPAEKANTPIIVLSADGQEEVKQESLQSGAHDFLLKPIKPEDLDAVLKRHSIGRNQSTASH